MASSNSLEFEPGLRPDKKYVLTTKAADLKVTSVDPVSTVWSIDGGCPPASKVIHFDAQNRDEVMDTIQGALLHVPLATRKQLIWFLNQVWLTKVPELDCPAPADVLWLDEEGGWQRLALRFAGHSTHYLISESGEVAIQTNVTYPGFRPPSLEELAVLRHGLILFPKRGDTFKEWLARANQDLVAASIEKVQEINQPVTLSPAPTSELPAQGTLQKEASVEAALVPETSPATSQVSEWRCHVPTKTSNNPTENDMSMTPSAPPSKIRQAATVLSAEAQDAAWRTASGQLTKLVRDPLVALISRGIGAEDDESTRKKVADFLATDAGKAMVQAVLAIALTSGVVAGMNNPQVERLARELRVGAMALTGDLVADVVMGPLRQIMAMYLQGLPEMPEASEPPQLPSPTPTTWESQEQEGEKVSG